MSQHYYEDGANHHDNHKEMNIQINGNASDSQLADLARQFFADDAAMVEVEPSADKEPLATANAAEETELFHFVYPAIADDEAWTIHRQVSDLVSRFPIKDICSFLKRLADEKKILLPQIPQNAFDELHRMGMPSAETSGFGYDNFCKYYKKVK